MSFINRDGTKDVLKLPFKLIFDDKATKKGEDIMDSFIKKVKELVCLKEQII